jgi:N-acetylmuramoyl-L-alanine amidase
MMNSTSYRKTLLGGSLLAAAVCGVYFLWVKPVDSATARMETDPARTDETQSAYALAIRFGAQPRFHITHWAQPQRIYLDLDDTPLLSGITPPAGSESLISGIHFPSPRAPYQRRIQIDFKVPVQFKSRIEQNGSHTSLILEVSPRAQRPVDTASASPVRSLTPAKTSGTLAKPLADPAIQYRNRRSWIVAIDAGHGGKDTGAIGPTGIPEKNVVLAIARKLADFIRAEPDMKPVMIRNGDLFVDLHQRVATARDAKADLFVSLHADAYINDQARGSSVFTLSDHGATSEAARWLADRENAALVGGVKLGGDDPTLASVLLDLSQDATLDASDRIAGKILHELKKDFLVHHQAIQKAGFVVLKSPDIPSLLVETAFISNPEEELNLIDPQHQTQIARAVFKGIRASFARIQSRRPPSLALDEIGK